MRAIRNNPALRLSLGLVCIVTGLLLALQLVLGPPLTPREVARQVRTQTSEALAVQLAALVRAGDVTGLHRTLADVVKHNPQIESIGLRQTDGQVLAQTREHLSKWIVPVDGGSTLTHIRVPLATDGGGWGQLEVSYAPLPEDGLRQMIGRSTLLPILLVGAFGLVAFYLYIRRSLQEFTPEQGVPERVRAAFDTLPPGVCILDNQGRIVLANRAVKCLQPVSTEDLLHKPLSSLDWLAPALPRDPAKHPWVTCLREQRPTPRELLRIPLASGKTVEALVSCAPIRDELGRLRGCLVTLDDVSDLYRVNERLLRALQELGSSQQRVQRQNEELYQLATRDVLTGCLNRRAFYEQAETLFARAAAQSAALACLLVDIDHFKRLNDEYGHLVGDQVIRSVAAVLSSGLREGDLLCRYGGEEFCILLPEATLEQAHQVAERLRLRIQKQVGPSLRVEDAPIVTGSFGIAMFDQDAELTVLIHRADQALYAAKNGGRNRVMLWPADSLSADPQVHAA